MQVITVGRERFSVSEALFSPASVGWEFSGLGAQVASAVALISPQEQHRSVLDNVMLSGGGTLMQGVNLDDFARSFPLWLVSDSLFCLAMPHRVWSALLP
jgi:hypothetical protein